MALRLAALARGLVAHPGKWLPHVEDMGNARQSRTRTLGLSSLAMLVALSMAACDDSTVEPDPAPSSSKLGGPAGAVQDAREFAAEQEERARNLPGQE
ncbi:hypothetical protein [Aeromicrobium sp. 179-A 4D2 NHS]|uniref:hypothetical protein n=1 Tax=Aeromicrobium sp. 179-A 4D2 NHS TaxID=3142375 RepID=UPI0039A3C74B